MRDVAQTRNFVTVGTALCRRAITVLNEDGFDGPSLPGWTRRHLVAHLCANAEAVGRLLHWASTGEPTPMYSSPEQRGADIDKGSRLAGAELASWFERSASELDAAFDSMTDAAWAAEVVTAQGRTVPAAETTWMRSREVLVHAVDLAAGVRFADLPFAFLAELRDEVLAKRAAEQLPGLAGELPAIVEYLVRRNPAGVTTTDGQPAPELGPWL